MIGKFNEVTGTADLLSQAMIKVSESVDTFAESLDNTSDKVKDLKSDLEELQDEGLNLGALALKDPTGIFQSEITKQAIEDIKEVDNGDLQVFDTRHKFLGAERYKIPNQLALNRGNVFGVYFCHTISKLQAHSTMGGFICTCRQVTIFFIRKSITYFFLFPILYLATKSQSCLSL